MEFSDFTAIVVQWCEQSSGTPLDCWIDDANARLVAIEGGVRCSIDVLDPYDAADPERVTALLNQGAASVACHCEGALAIDPDSHCLVLVSWQPRPCPPQRLLERLENLANQRAAMLSLLRTTLDSLAASASGRPTLHSWQPGV
ncbi:type III secretion protein [Pseudomonas gingeri NCPPB 3146 = LMG 5327]|uniref:Type III secretion protein n=2 Tax=Pseudomonas gingeri TaxID=117681 RepID=A0A7Y8CHD9_9PSED|nr:MULTISPECIES: hypothetical protein [Pseudomonas]NVZ28567.1 type III secretion protein [Pseudomonas gingeri]NVZ62665.1 type III secretion protein [Pseudomonas gingeri]NVZ76492.1 type III secretion protein [Pseudomonas gingeri]NWA08367.1 type III secretion protein [Pseudomonas gingeri]NWC18176.1 type III secretion protein [Pseudomonas gingeri]